MKQNLFNKLWLRVGMIVAIMTTALAGTVKAESYTITFNSTTTANDGSAAISTISDIVASGSDYITSITDCEKVYKGKSGYGVKLGSSSAIGKFTMNLSSEGQVNATKITFNACKYGSDNSSLKVTINGTSSQTFSLTSSLADYEFTTSSEISSIKIEGVTKRIYVKSVTVTYSTGGTSTCAAPTISGDESFLTSTQVSIDCATTGATIQYSTNNGSSWTTYTAPFTLTETTTVQAKATKSGMTDSDVASKTFTKITPLANIAALTAETETGNYYVTLNNAVVTYVNGNYAYIQDASGAVVLYKSSHGLTAGDVLNGTATVAYQLRNANPQITTLSGVTPVSGTAPNPTSVAASAWSYTFSNVLSQYFQITGATITQSNSKYYVSLNNESIQLYKASGSISSLDLTKTYTITGFPTLYNTTKELQIFADPEVEVSSDPTIIATPNTLSDFTYEAGNGPSTSKTFTVSGANLTANLTLSLGNNSDFEMSTIEGSGYTNSLTLTQSSGTVDETTVYVRMKSDLAVGNYNGTITLTSTGATTVEVSLSGSVTAPEALHVTWNLATNSYDSNPTENLVTWSSSYATMTNAKGSGTAANNYLGGDSNNRTSSRFYNGNTLTITPASGYAITSVVFEATGSSYASALSESTWTNATASVEGSTVTVTPTDGSTAISAAITGTCGFTEVKVYYEVDNTTYYNINLDNAVQNGNIAADINKAAEGVTVTLTATPDENYALTEWTVLDGNADEVTVTVSPGNANVATFTMPASDVEVSATFTTTLTYYTVTIDNSIEHGTVESDKATAIEGATVTLTVTPDANYALNEILVVPDGTGDVAVTKVNNTTYTFPMPADNVTITAEFVGVTTNTYTLATAITSGKHYVIASGADGDVKVMGTQNTNNRAAVEGSVSGTTLSVISNAGAVEFVIYGPDADSYYTIYDASTPGYLYAVGGTSSNHLKTESTPAAHGHWTIEFDNDGKASIVANISGRNTMRFNSANNPPVFSCYASGQQDIYLYEKAGEATPTESKTLNASGYASYASQNALDFTNADGFTAWAVKEISGTTITFSQITGSVPAGTGMLLKGTPSGSATMTSATGATALTSNLLIGTTADFTVENDGDYYGLKGASFVPVAQSTVPAGKALLPKAAVEGSGVKAFTFVFEEDDATAIEMVNGQSSMVNGPIYNLAGQRISKMQKGINIVNGKKVLK